MGATVQLTKTVPQNADKIVGLWLLGCSGMVFGAVILGEFMYQLQHVKLCAA